MNLSFSTGPKPGPGQRVCPVSEQTPPPVVRRDTVHLSDGSMTAVFRVTGMQYDFVEADDLSKFQDALHRALNSMPPGMRLRVLYRVQRASDHTFHEVAQNLDGTDAFARYVSLDQLRRMRESARAGQLFEEELLIALTHRPLLRPRGKGKRTPVLPFGSQSIVPKRLMQDYLEALEQFEQEVEHVAVNLRLATLKPERLKTADLIPMVQNRLHPSETLLGEEMTAPGWLLRKNCVEIGETLHAAISIRETPVQTWPGLGVALSILPFPHTLSVDTVLTERHETWSQYREAQERKSERSHSRTDDSPWLDLPSAILALHPEHARREEERKRAALAGSNEPEPHFAVRLGYTLLIEADNEEDLDRRVDHALALCQQMGIRASRTGDPALVAEALERGFFFGRAVDPDLRATTRTAAALLPLYGRWKGSARANALFADRMGRLVRHDPYPRNLLNRNKVVVGSCGTGKSFAVQIADLMPHVARRDTEVLVIESGGSYRGLVETMGGVLIQAGPNSPIHYNPFDLPPSFDDMTQDMQEIELRYKYGFIQKLVLQMCRLSNPQQWMLAENVIGIVAKRTYETERTPRLRDFYRLLGQYKNPQDPDSEAVAQQIYTLLDAYVVNGHNGNGLYASYFDCHTDFDVQAPIVSFDFIDVRNDRTLMAPLFMSYVGGLVYNRLLQRDGKERLIVIDEITWAMGATRENEHGTPVGQMIETFWREGRKLGAGSIGIAQNYGDLANANVGRAILGNSSLNYLLQHERHSFNDQGFRAANFSAQKMEAVYGLKTHYGEYSEIMVREETDWAVVRIHSSPLQYWLATSDPRDLQVKRRYMLRFHEEQGYSKQAVYAFLAHTYPQGTHREAGEEISAEAAMDFMERWSESFARFSQRIARGLPTGLDDL